ncbi:glutathione reductase (NADPH) [Acetitomaculum ruminis DSM 5522]|uniref:Glutathione reductase (NADPH) n=1 Tax=Acetitomaculum ruminis DSM 5522 TaxID=1120918 RepID=A0A1I0ZYS0_9FIRM|nr:NAD(P)/FAD-dependent oxidoreductase [Acetitomaculum ruminis]SFB30834.1 glutathione reductase (NADPH) [Acetitomaculum ruminis DSM 5522]
MTKYDVIFIGSGHSCNHGGIMLAMSGKKVAFVEMGKIGGTCTNYGCDAKILLDGPFEYLDGLKRYEGLCVESDVKIDWTRLMSYKKQTLGVFDPILEKLFSDMGVDVIRGRGRIKDAHTVEVDGTAYETEYIVIGTGQRNAQLQIPGKEFTHGSSHFLDLDEMPDSIIFIGAGIISMEFASMALALGKKVQFFEFAPRALMAYPQEYVKKLVEKMESQGAVFHFNEAVASVEKEGSQYKVTSQNGVFATADYVLDATGRVANFEDLGLEELGIKASRKGIEVDDHMRTSVSNIFASGDVVDKTIPKLTPTAEYESNYIAAQILGILDAPIVYPVIPNLVFTLPRIGQVGVSLDDAKASPDAYKVVNIPWGVQNDWVNNHETDTDVNLIFDKKGYLVGAAIYGSEAGTWLDYLTLVIDKKMTAADLRGMIMSFPTQTYMLWSALLPHLKMM